MLLPLLLCVLILYIAPVEGAAAGTVRVLWSVTGLMATNALLSGLGAALAVRLERRSSGAGLRVWRVLAGVLVGLTLAAAYVFHWPAVPARLVAAPYRILLDDLVLLAPVLVMILTQMGFRYWFERRRRGSMSLSLPRYLLLRTRVELAMVLAPWLLLMLMTDLGDRVFESTAMQTPVALGAVGLIVVISPVIIRYVWNTSPLPDGPLRERLERLCERTNFRCNDLLLWHTDRHMANAGVVGPTPLVRYVLLSDVMLERFEPQEVEAVFAHEVGHVRCRHMLFYLVFAIAFGLFFENLVYALWSTGLVQAADVWFGGVAPYTVLMLLTAVLYWGLGFGIISRRMEQQADLFALENAEKPLAFVVALEKLAATDYVPRRSSFWRHFSIDQRTEFLHRVLREPEAGEAYARRVRRVKWSFCLVAVGAAANLGLIWLLQPEFFAA